MTVSVAVVCICSADHLRRCLHALDAQEGVQVDEIVAACDPHIEGLDEVARDHPQVRVVRNAGQRTPLELASRALQEATGDLVLLTEDHCIPAPDWARSMLDAQAEGRAVVGGRVEVGPDVSATDWAFYFVDFFRYAAPVEEGPAPSLTVCNAAYRRDHLDEVRDVWNTYFHETAIHDELRRRFGSLWLAPASIVTMSRHATLGDAVYERYAFGRLFGCTRIGFVSGGKRLFYAALAPTLPVLLMGRMAAKAMRSATLLRSFLRSIVPLTLMVLAWSWGEWLGYLTGRHPRSLVVAPEIRASRRAATP